MTDPAVVFVEGGIADIQVGDVLVFDLDDLRDDPDFLYPEFLEQIRDLPPGPIRRRIRIDFMVTARRVPDSKALYARRFHR